MTKSKLVISVIVLEPNGNIAGPADDTVKTEQSTAFLQIANEGDVQANSEEQRKWETAAVALAYISVFSLVALGSFSFYVSSITNSAAAFGFGFDCFLDVGTSVVVIWRFYGKTSTSYSVERELKALLFLGILFILAAISVAGKSIKYLVDGTLVKTSAWLYGLAVCSTLICMFLSISKFYTAYKLNSQSVRADGYSSLACGITSFTIIISSLVYSSNKNVYYLDDIIGIILSVLLLCYGIKLCVEVCSSSAANNRETKLTVMKLPGYESMK
ncbi:transmembrane protein 163-like [Anneissia japonica]|uniref:transmembrane protein 163-like n=1 Tax=Anneissia japonica TaxID=1529436 RepID=UPI0014258BE2|nr:transmembrane protein 163-like [Anneissia japonica]